MEHSELYYTMSGYHRFSFEPEAKPVENQAGFDLFRIGFKLYEGKSGMMIDRFRKMRDLTDMVADLELDTDYQEKLKADIEQWTERYGASPRYTRPETTRVTEAKAEMRARALDDNGRHTYVEVHNADGLALYALKSEMKKRNYPIYLLHQEWMFPVGYIFSRLWVAENISKHGPPDFQSYCTKRLDGEIGVPGAWASLGCAAFLGRMDEAKEHNKVILEKREAQRQKRIERDESFQRYFREQNQAAYGPLLAEAARAIAAHRPVDNIQKSYGSSLILQLFDLYQIDVPTRTQFWVARYLQQISYDKTVQAWTCTYDNKEPFDRNFPSLLNVLVQAATADRSGDTVHLDFSDHLDSEEDEWER